MYGRPASLVVGSRAGLHGRPEGVVPSREEELCQPCPAEMLTNQLVPNLSVHMPKTSPQSAFSSGIVTVPPAESFSKYPRSSASSSPLSDIEKLVPGVNSIRFGTSAAMNLIPLGAVRSECMTRSSSLGSDEA